MSYPKEDDWFSDSDSDSDSVTSSDSIDYEDPEILLAISKEGAEEGTYDGRKDLFTLIRSDPQKYIEIIQEKNAPLLAWGAARAA